MMRGSSDMVSAQRLSQRKSVQFVPQSSQPHWEDLAPTRSKWIQRRKENTYFCYATALHVYEKGSVGG
jgi:hypothetical protein